MSDDRKAKGREMLDKLCGNADGVNGLPQPLRDFTVEHLFGDLWQGKDLPLQERSLVTCTILTALARRAPNSVSISRPRNGLAYRALKWSK